MWVDHYNYPRSVVEDFKYRVGVLAEWCERIGRNPAEIETSLQVRVSDIGTAVGEASAAFEAGADHVIFMLPPPRTPALVEDLADAAGGLLG